MLCISAAYAVMRCPSVCHVREFCQKEQSYSQTVQDRVAKPFYSQAPHFTLVKEALIEIGCVVTSLVVGWLVGWSLVVGCHARALWPNGAS